MATENIVQIDLYGTTIDLNGADADWTYRIEANSYTPPLAQLTGRRLGEEIYGETVERFTIAIRGTSTDQMWAALHGLQNAMNEAVLYDLGQRAQPVTFIVQPRRTTGLVYQNSVILPVPGTPMVQAPATILKGADGYLIEGVKLVFRRRPLLLSPSDTDTVTGGASAAQGSIWSMSFTQDYDTFVPTDIDVGSFSPAGGSAPGPGLFAVGPSAALIPILDSATFGSYTTPASWSTVAEATAQGGNVRRYTPSSTAAELAICTHTGQGYRKALFALLRNNSASKEYMIRGVSRVQATAYYGRPAVVDGSLLTPQLIPLGVVNTPAKPTSLGIEITPSATGGTIDFDLLQAVYLDDAPVAMAWINKIELANFGVVSSWDLRMRHNYLGLESGQRGGRPLNAAYQSSTLNVPLTIYGDNIVYTGASGAAASLIMPDRTFWCIGNGTRQNASLTMTRTRTALGLR